MDTILAGVSPVEFYDNNHNLYMTAMALTDAGFNTSVSEDIVRAGSSNGRIGSYFYDSNLGLTLTSVTFSLEYLASKLGSVIEANGDVFTNETITTTVANTITVTKTPIAPFADSAVVYGWYKLPTESNWNTITFNGVNATVSDLASGTTVCVKYAYEDLGSRSFRVSSEIVPNIAYALMKIPMLKSGTAQENYTSASKVGEMQVKIPKFQFDPNTDLALTSSGHASISLAGNALINYTGSCDNSGWYAEIVEVIYGKDEFADVKAIVIEDSDIDLAVGETQTLVVYKLFNGIVAPSILANSKITFVSSTPATATVSSGGVVTAVTGGTTSITATVTGHTNLVATALVTVS